jgi:hypothetical protein
MGTACVCRPCAFEYYKGHIFYAYYRGHTGATQGPHRGHTGATQGPLVKTKVFATFHALK